MIGTPPQRASVILDTGSGAVLACFAMLCRFLLIVDGCPNIRKVARDEILVA